MVRSNFEHLLQDQFKVFADAGYKVKSQILNASHYGVAQDRKRIFIVGIHERFGMEYNFPQASHGEGLKPYTTIKDAIGDLPDWPTGQFYDADFHWYYMSRNRRQSWEQVSKTIVANPRHMPLHPISPELEKLGPDKWRLLLINQPDVLATGKQAGYKASVILYSLRLNGRL
jgi:DNA (cytosine-5)-methyltransferase 1